MWARIFNVLLLPAVLSFHATAQTKPAVDYVNPFTGTGGDKKTGFGNTFPGAAYPFGMIQLSPDNGGQGWQYCSGYRYQDSCITGFSHTHLSGTGVGDFADISLMPTCKEINPNYFLQSDDFVKEYCQTNGLDPNGFLNKDGQPGPFTKNFLLKYRSAFSHSDERASPGYYSVKLTDDNIEVELTTSEYVGMHRYRFSKPSDQQNVILNLGFNINSDKTTKGLLNFRSSELVTGYRFSTGKATIHRVYFAMQFNRSYTKRTCFLTDSITPNLAKGTHLAGVFTFNGQESRELLIKVAISSVSEEGALRNLKTADKY
jgi:putative alpha-1,2-mannosidase